MNIMANWSLRWRLLRAFGASSAIAQRNYDPKTVETIQGKVLSVEKTQLQKAGRWGPSDTADGQGDCLGALGPGWYIDKQTPQIEANDTITVTGSRVTSGRKAGHHRRAGEERR